MSKERAERIRQYRLRQAQFELDRKAAKARDRANLWTQEELDASEASAERLHRFLNDSKRVNHGQ